MAQVLFTAFKSGSAGTNIAASSLVLLTWLYILGLVVLLGAVVNAVLSNRSEDVDITPVVGDAAESVAGTADVGRERLLSELDALATRLPEGESVTLSVDSESLPVAPPGSVSVDRESSVFGLDDSVALTLRWWPEDD